MEDKQEEENYGYGHVNDVLSEKCRNQVFLIYIYTYIYIYIYYTLCLL